MTGAAVLLWPKLITVRSHLMLSALVQLEKIFSKFKSCYRPDIFSFGLSQNDPIPTVSFEQPRCMQTIELTIELFHLAGCNMKPIKCSRQTDFTGICIASIIAYSCIHMLQSLHEQKVNIRFSYLLLFVEGWYFQSKRKHFFLLNPWDCTLNQCGRCKIDFKRFYHF